ncbi:MAG: hypothetical protein RXR36_04775 [Nitrososphaeria archaeon]
MPIFLKILITDVGLKFFEKEKAKNKVKRSLAEDISPHVIPWYVIAMPLSSVKKSITEL